MKKNVRHLLLQVSFLSCSTLLYAAQAAQPVKAPMTKESELSTAPQPEGKNSAIIGKATQSLARVIIAVNANNKAATTLDTLAHKGKNEINNFLKKIKADIPQEQREDVKKFVNTELKEAVSEIEAIFKKHQTQIIEHYKKTVDAEAQKKASEHADQSIKTINALVQEAGNDTQVKQLGNDLKRSERPGAGALDQLGIHKSDVNAVLRAFKKIKI